MIDLRKSCQLLCAGLALLGAGFAATPWLLGFSYVEAATANSVLAGCALMFAGAAGWFVGPTPFRWLALAIGLWLVLAPWLLGFEPVASAVWANMIVGAAAITLSFRAIAGWTPDGASGPDKARPRRRPMRRA